jgi:hypothetical protein
MVGIFTEETIPKKPQVAMKQLIFLGCHPNCCGEPFAQLPPMIHWVMIRLSLEVIGHT